VSQQNVGPSGSPLVGRGDADRHSAITRSLLGYGLLAGPSYVASGLAQALARDGFQLAHHDLSLLANGPWGWVQTLTFLLTGAMVVAAGVGMRRACRTLGERPGGTWGPWLVVVFGLGLVGAGVFPADPVDGFPPGARAVTTLSGTGHIVCAAVGFLALVAGCLVHARRLRSVRPGLARLSVVTAVLFLLAFAALASGSSAAAVVLGSWVALLLVWTWLAFVSLDLFRRTPLLTPA
jgi:hypothetical membrane protein